MLSWSVIYRFDPMAQIVDLEVLQLPYSVLQDPCVLASIPDTVCLSDIVKRILDPVRVGDAVHII